MESFRVVNSTKIMDIIITPIFKVLQTVLTRPFTASLPLSYQKESRWKTLLTCVIKLFKLLLKMDFKSDLLEFDLLTRQITIACPIKEPNMRSDKTHSSYVSIYDVLLVRIKNKNDYLLRGPYLRNCTISLSNYLTNLIPD